MSGPRLAIYGLGVIIIAPAQWGHTAAACLCDAKWGGLETEADGAVVIGGWEVDQNPDAPCSAVGISLATTVRLPSPVGDRVIIDAWTGQPVTPSPAFPAPSPS
jgi:hypothetical protein